MTDSLFRSENDANGEIFDDKQTGILQKFYESYRNARSEEISEDDLKRRFHTLIDLVARQIRHPYPFEIFHRSERKPFDFYRFGLDFIRPLIDFKHSRVFGNEQIAAIRDRLSKKENVIFFANHQTEPDPQIISLLLEQSAPELATEMIFLAGHRVVSDPLAVPLSRGCNLLCIYSKKYIDYSEDKGDKILHNQRTMKKMSELLSEGGKCIYVAPSGGRDRPDASGKPVVSVFDPQSIELFSLISKRAARPSHFYPLALKTYRLMPPPDKVEQQLGETRIVNRTPVYLAIGKEIDMEHFPGDESTNKKTKQIKRSEYIRELVCQDYCNFLDSE